MSYYTVVKGGVTEYRGAEKPDEHDGYCVLPKPKGKIVTQPYILTGPHDGDPPEMPRGSTPRPTGRPNRINKARGFGPGNTR
jgi:hypothetical protein